MADSQDFSRSIPFGIRRGPGKDPADRAPRRGATTGIAPDGKQVVHVPGEGLHHPSQAPPTIPTPAPNRPDIDIVSEDDDDDRDLDDG
jgi:hypothetical protein